MSIRDIMQAKRDSIKSAAALPKVPDVLPAQATINKRAGQPEKLRLFLQQLYNDVGQLKAVSDLAEKQTIKKGLLANYTTFVAAYIDAGDNYPNPVAVQVMIWLFDVMAVEAALKIALVLVGQNQAMPENFGRNMPTYVCDALYDWANIMLVEGWSASPYLDELVGQLPGWDERYTLPVPVVSKCYAMLAKHKEREGDMNDNPAMQKELYQRGFELCEMAQAHNPEKHGTKTLARRLNDKRNY
ncbi:phage terminase small subunit [Methylovulum psychrotolerans]|uniref:Terminase n=1 Tax=Methylovulum psychrotolerans TaxID=1704499 RepID=A0A2S5CGG9_9GAMM|nr:phage terminase small subunit [Methylovulum psychrotolerans]POZ49894.1 hypothetical protein AADEFJLK_04340 [Methylovulum psychrotolerans]